jgi:ribosomal protein L7Ae-like RNA K-turn-binding protein
MSDDEDKKVIGYRQSVSCINEKKVRKAFLAQDVEEKMKNELIYLMEQKGISYELVSSKRELGKTHGLKVSASIVCLIN